MNAIGKLFLWVYSELSTILAALAIIISVLVANPVENAPENSSAYSAGKRRKATIIGLIVLAFIVTVGGLYCDNNYCIVPNMKGMSTLQAIDKAYSADLDCKTLLSGADSSSIVAWQSRPSGSIVQKNTTVYLFPTSCSATETIPIGFLAAGASEPYPMDDTECVSVSIDYKNALEAAALYDTYVHEHGTDDGYSSKTFEEPHWDVSIEIQPYRSDLWTYTREFKMVSGITNAPDKARFIVEVKNALERIAEDTGFYFENLFEDCTIIGRLFPYDESVYETDAVLLDTTNHNGVILMPTEIEEGCYIFEFCLIIDNACYEWYHNIFFTSPKSE